MRQEFLRCYIIGSKKDIDDNENVFDVVAGTSIGAINAAFLVSYVIKRMREENKNVGESWKGSAEELEEFWKSRLASNINLNKWWPFSWDEKSWTLAWDVLSTGLIPLLLQGKLQGDIILQKNL